MASATVPARLAAAGAGILGASVLADSGLEHYRGSFRNPAMVLPIAAAALALPLNLRRALNDHGGGRRADIAAVAVGLAGFGFHTFNLRRQPGGMRLVNLFYKAPLGAPGALVLAGLLGRASRHLRADATHRQDPRRFGALCAAGLAGTVAEASLLHFRGAFHNPAMWLPLAIPPVASASLARDLAHGRRGRTTPALLGLTAALGLIGSAFHAWGISRNMGGWRNWRQNLLVGPPLPAPPAFTGIALAAIGALLLLPGARRG